MNKIKWGILSTAKIAREKVIPAMQKSNYCDVAAVASRNFDHAKEVAGNLNITKYYGSYEELLNDEEIDAIYIPLPNHMHVEWCKKAIEANKHVLCEKPIAMSAKEASELFEFANQHPHVKVMEAFMYRFHPQWQHAKKLINDGRIGELKMVQSFFSYYNSDLNNIRNKKSAGGGGLMDIGCYCISFARFLFDAEPQRVIGSVEYDEVSQTDTFTSGILDFGSVTSSFTCSTRLMPYQRVNILGSEGRIEIEIPVNTPPDKSTQIWLHLKTGTEEIVFEPVDQYTLQCDAFSKCIINNEPVPIPLEDAVNNMKVIDAVIESSSSSAWISL